MQFTLRLWIISILFNFCTHSFLGQEKNVFSKLLEPPIILTNDIQLKYVGATSGNIVRIVYDSTNKVFYTNTFNGDVYRVSIANDGSFNSRIFIQASTTHKIGRAQGLLWFKNMLYLAGNEVDDLNKRSKGRVIKFPINKDGNWESPQNILTTEYYSSSNVLFDHNFSALCLNKTKDSLLIASGSRTDHGEVKDVNGKYPNLREDALTSKIFIIPLNSTKEIILKNDYNDLKSSGYIFSEGVRNEFDIAYNSKGEIFGVENNGDRDDPEELNLLKKGKHYGFPWVMGGNTNPQQLSSYNPNTDLLLPNNLYNRAIFYNDPTFPIIPKDIKFEEPIINIGPDANWVRDPQTGKFYQIKNIASFTSHRSPLGLLFDSKNQLASPYTSDGFVLAYSTGGGASGYLNAVDQGADLCQIEFIKTAGSSTYQISVKRIASGFKDLVDAVLVDNKMYLLQNDGGIYEVTFPLNRAKPTISIASSSNSIVIGDKVEFSAIVKDNWEIPEYSWSVNGKEINNYTSNFSSTSLANGDVVTCSIKNYFEDGNQINILSNSISLVVKPLFIQPSLVKSGNCIGSRLSVNSNPILKLIWKKDGKEIYNSANLDPAKIENFILAQAAGVYMAEITTVYGSYSTNSIEILDIPKAPIISNESDLILVSSEKWGNQWYYENSILNGDTLQKYKVLKSGNYKLKYKNTLGCTSDFSKEKNILILGVNKEKNEYLVISPNPFNSFFKIEFKEIESIKYDLLLFDLTGKLILTKKFVRSGDIIDLSYIPSGNFILRLKNELDGSIEVKLTKN
ncbi:T9SS type A sorting domain-containing protein [Aquirufa ecclesiirivi]|uniref:T9SS type A sorting domain-containing protein n=1 Tax=Aquirufa ecclesiirivi TaxID=2715124 RepID=A0ABT4JG11_9BACT|nr:PQQ-dependent sugar dehydrogenase [Aquirufa ecclesiirivi]MCZ2474675.1 T9SS type A sorting domain-containing protein [Aquirufa ecclesiirivi]